jgi:hypothetical protein
MTKLSLTYPKIAQHYQKHCLILAYTMCPNNFKPHAMFDNILQNIFIFPLNSTLQAIDKNFYDFFVISQMLSRFGNEWVKTNVI